MSMTKDFLFSLPEEEQNAILGAHDPDYEAYWDAYEAETKTIRPPVGSDDYPDYGDLDDESW